MGDDWCWSVIRRVGNELVIMEGQRCGMKNGDGGGNWSLIRGEVDMVK